jgi:hypothetical protein
LVRWLFTLGIAATLAANVTRGLGHRLAGVAVAAWPAVALVGSFELLMMVIRNAQASANSETDSTCPVRGRGRICYRCPLPVGSGRGQRRRSVPVSGLLQP